MDELKKEVSPKEFPTAKGILDGTECQIQKTTEDAYSGKKKQYSLKYQVTIGISTGKVHHIYGPLVKISCKSGKPLCKFEKVENFILLLQR